MTKESTMSWNKPSFADRRLGFEVTMYVAAR